MKYPLYIWLTLHRTDLRWRFCKILWPSQNIWTLSKLKLTLCWKLFNYKKNDRKGSQKTSHRGQAKLGGNVYNFFDRIFLPFRPPKTKKSAIAHWKLVIKQRKKKLLKSELGNLLASLFFYYCSLFFFTPLFRSYTERMFISCCLESKWYLLSIGKRYNYNVPTA